MINESPSSLSKHWVIIPAAGVGARMQSACPKQYLKLGCKTILELTVELFSSDKRFETIWIGVSESDEYYAKIDWKDKVRIKSFSGGVERCDTVLNGLNALEDIASDSDWVWVHDAARPCVHTTDLDKLFVFTERENDKDDTCSDGAVIAAPLVDTIKYSGDGVAIDKSVDRSKLWRALTPQVFRYSSLKRALEMAVRAGENVTDEASAIELSGGRPILVEGSEENMKITRPGDIERASFLLKKMGRA